MKHHPAQAVTWNRSVPDHFSGEVWNSILSDEPSGVKTLAVQFSPGARTDWHTHPEGQVLYCVTGAGFVQNDEGLTIEIGPGDVVHAPPGVLHWHGASPHSPMMHLSLTTGGETQWSDRRVTDDEYGG